MKTIYRSATLILLALTSLSPVAVAQDGMDEAAVWTVIESQWRAEQRGDRDWVERLLSADFVGWPYEAPAPRNKMSTRLWSDFTSQQVEVIEFELYPLSILIHGDMAIAHYLYTTATKPADEPVQVRNGRFTDVLVRDDDSCNFISWHGGETP